MRRLHRQMLEALRGHLAGGRAQPPTGGVMLWNAFNKLSATRSWHAHGPNPISYQEIEAHCRLMRLPLEPHHIEIITAMDAAWVSHVQLLMASGTMKGAKVVPRGSGRPLTSAAFDGMFGRAA